MSKKFSYRQFIGTLSLRLISRGIAMLLGVIYARYLGPEQFGLYSFVMAIITIATLPVVAGLHNLLVREIANFSEKKQWNLVLGIINWSRIYIFGLSLIIIVLIYLSLYSSLFEDSVSELLWIAVLLIPLRGILGQQESILNGFSQPVRAQLPTKIFSPLFILILLLIYIFSDVNLSGKSLITVSVFASFLSILASALFLSEALRKKLYNSKPKYNIKKWQLSLMPFTMMAIISTFNSEVASIFLGWLLDKESVGYFKVAIQAVALISLGLMSVNAVIMPNVARLYKAKDIKATQALLTKSVLVSTSISLPVILILIGYGEFIISLLFGAEYLPAYPILIALCFGQLVNVLMGSVGVVLNMTGNERSSLKSLTVSLLLNLLLLFFLIPLYGGLGAGIAVSISLVYWNISMAIDVYHYTKLKTWVRFKIN